MDDLRLIQNQIRTKGELIVTQTLITLGITSGEITYARALEVYGKWFSHAVECGNITPSRYDSKSGRIRWFRVVDILSLRAAELEKAQAIINGKNNLI